MASADLPSPDRPTAWEWILFIFLCGLWGSTYFFVAIALREVGPTLLALLRLGLATATLACVVGAQGIRLPRRVADYAWIGVLAVVNYVVPFNLLMWAQLHVTSGLTAILSSTTPIFVFLLTTWVVRQERFNWRRLVGVLVSFSGITLLFVGDVSGRHPNALAGQAAILVSSVFYACGSLLAFRITHRSSLTPVHAAYLQTGFAFLLQIPVVAVVGEYSGVALTAGPAVAILWLGVLGSGVAYMLYFRLIRAWGPMRASLNTYLHPLVAVTLGVLLLGEALTWRTVVPVLLILGGVLAFSLATRSVARPHSPPAVPQVR